ncbi:MAG: 3-hydroxyacyl-CoA dehydrogenase NAD-binding domain-containing protein [Ginsengibacter sp.]
MKEKVFQAETVLLAGNGNLTWSIAACLLNAGHVVNLWTNGLENSSKEVLAHLHGTGYENASDFIENHRLSTSENLDGFESCGMVIAITQEDPALKLEIISQLEDRISPDVLIGINTESIGLDVLQENAKKPGRIIGLNWAEPAHTTRFLEIIGNQAVNENITSEICSLAQMHWKKDPYVVENFGIRSRLISAMVREAFYLVGNGYASVEDIDRACRNDAGYYLPFTGNCRYMDLMGTYAYGMVMKDLNPNLSKEKQVPDFFTDILKDGGKGMQNGKGLYLYTDEEVKRWHYIINKFSYQIEKVINKYPFNYKKKKSI